MWDAAQANLTARVSSFVADVAAQRAEAVTAPAEEPPPELGHVTLTRYSGGKNMEETMNKIPILIWEDKNWAEIPQQDNPAFNKKGRRNKSILVMKVLPYEATAVGENSYCVIEVPLEGDVFRKGLFWKLEDAKLFAEALSTRTTQPQKEDKQ